MLRHLNALALLTFATSAAFALPSEAPRIERAIEAQTSAGAFAGAVLVARDAHVLLSRGYGKANLEWGIPNSPQTRYRLGSLTKQFTAASVLRLAEQGKLRIDDPIIHYLPDAPAAWRPITFFHLLTHTSGIPDLTQFPDFDAREPFATTPAKLIEWFKDKPLQFPVGTQYRYSNSGYLLLGYLIEKISGQTYSQFVQNNLFDRLAMKDSGYDSNVKVIPRHAEGYTNSQNGLAVAGYIDMSIPFAAGGLYSTTGDLLRWEKGLFGGRVLCATSVARMTTPFMGNYAMGLYVDRDAQGNRVLLHGGNIEGFSSFLAYVPDERISVIVLANIEGTAARDMALKILQIEGHQPTILLGMLQQHVGAPH